jgi:hypothetical protein
MVLFQSYGGDAWRAGWPGFHGPAADDVHELSTALMCAVTAAADQAKGETTVLRGGRDRI